MSIQWTLIAGFLYLELGIILIMLLSFIKPQLWRSLLTSRFMQSLFHQSNLYLFIFIGILLLFFGESIREFYKYSGKVLQEDRHYSGSTAHYEDQMRLFRGQRNLYISGFALFCLFIIRRIASLISEQGKLKIALETLKSLAERNAQFSLLQENQAATMASDSSQCEKSQSSGGPACDCAGKQVSNCGDTTENDKQSKERITELEKQILKLEEELTKWKDLAETSQAELEDIRVANIQLKKKYGQEDESRKDK